MAVTAPSDPTATAELVLRALCWPPTHDQPDVPEWPFRDGHAGLGEIIETAILHKVLCLLAHRWTTTGLDRHLPRTIRRFLSGALRANQYTTRLYRAEIARIMAVFGQAGLTAVALNGIAAESSLYGGTGARQFTDLDVLLAPEDMTLARRVLTYLGYHNSAARSTAFTRHVKDILVPRITLDLTHSLHHTTGEDGVRDILSRRGWQPLPGYDQPLPVLSAPDALLHCLARLDRATCTPPQVGSPRWALCADVLRLVRTCENSTALVVPAAAMAGWVRMRDLWPQLPPIPLPAGNS